MNLNKHRGYVLKLHLFYCFYCTMLLYSGQSSVAEVAAIDCAEAGVCNWWVREGESCNRFSSRSQQRLCQFWWDAISTYWLYQQVQQVIVTSYCSNTDSDRLHRCCRHNFGPCRILPIVYNGLGVLPPFYEEAKMFEHYFGLVYTVFYKKGDTVHMLISLLNLNRFS